MKLYMHCAWLALGLFLVAGTAVAAQQVVRIGIVVDGPWERGGEIRGLVESEITALLGSEFDVRFPPEALVVADWTPSGIRAALDRLLDDPAVDLVIAMGMISSGVAGTLEDPAKPVIAPFVLDAELQGMPRADGASGVRNLSYIAHPFAVERDLRAFLDVVPFERVAVLMNGHYLAAIPAIGAGLPVLAQELGIDIVPVPITQVDDAALAVLPTDVDAVYLAPLTLLRVDEFEQLVEELIRRRLPSFSVIGEVDVRRGVLAGLNPESYWPRIARRVALNTQRILLGEEAGSLPVAFPREELLAINMATARAIGVSPPWRVLTEAMLINEERVDISRRLTLVDAVREAVDVNLDLLAQTHVVAAGRRDVRLARSQLLPEAKVVGLGTVIDRDRAEASFGTQAQRTLTGSATVSQLLYSEPAWANLSVQRRLQEARERDRDALELDILLEAGLAYLDVLRAKTLERIHRENLQLTRSNLDFARVRVTLGMASSGEVYRWESQVAAGRQLVIAASAGRNIAEIALNRLLHRPLEEPFATEETGIEDLPLMTGVRTVRSYMGDRRSFRLFRAFMVSEALSASPELRQLDAIVAARERALASSRRAYFAPTIAVQSDIANLFTEGGAGAEPPAAFAGSPEADDLSWSVGLQVSLPLFLGGARPAAVAGAREELAGLQLEREALAERVEQRARATLHKAGASLANIDLARDGAEAARQSLQLVTDAYSGGGASLVELLDAQNASVLADLAAADAVYEFLADMLAVERAIGCYQFLSGADERRAFFERLADYFAAEGNVPRPE